MDILPVSAMREERRQTQYFPDVTQLNEGRQRRSETVLDLNSQETKDEWHATQVANHARLFLISDNLTTLMFIVAGDLTEAHRETHKFPFSPGNECH